MDKRLCVFQMYDEDGIADDYIIYWLRQIKKNHFDLVVVVNGRLKEYSEENVNQYADILYFREDSGYDSMAYKEVLLNVLGKDRVRVYSECLLLNDTVFGPFVPLKKILDDMKDCICDFWGLTEQYEISDFWGGITCHIIFKLIF